MKKIISRSWLRLTTTLLSSFFSLLSFAQDKGIDIDINVKKEQAWYQNPSSLGNRRCSIHIIVSSLIKRWSEKSLIALRWIYRKPDIYPVFFFLRKLIYKMGQFHPSKFSI
jgi:hypothetical protein